MFARVTTYELAGGRASESIDAFRPAIDSVREIEGLVDAYFMVERDGRRAMTMTLWESLDAMERSRVAASSARTEAASLVASTYELEVGIQARAAERMSLGGGG
jgi:heme-degrading monooxygenase HmoA